MSAPARTNRRGLPPEAERAEKAGEGDKQAKKSDTVQLAAEKAEMAEKVPADVEKAKAAAAAGKEAEEARVAAADALAAMRARELLENTVGEATPLPEAPPRLRRGFGEVCADEYFDPHPLPPDPLFES